jgi:hypothetical protein
MKTTNNKKQLIAALAAVAALNPDGYTVDARTLQPVTSGYAVAVLDTQNSFGADGLARVVDYVAAHDHVTAFGGWLDRETGLYYYDATIICSTLEEAKDMARKNKQIAIFDLDNLQEIRL